MLLHPNLGKFYSIFFHFESNLLFFNQVNYIGGLQLGKGTATDPVGCVMEFISTNLRNAIETDERLHNRRMQMELAKQIASGMNFLHSLNPFILVKENEVFFT